MNSRCKTIKGLSIALVVLGVINLMVSIAVLIKLNVNAATPNFYDNFIDYVVSNTSSWTYADAWDWWYSMLSKVEFFCVYGLIAGSLNILTGVVNLKAAGYLNGIEKNGHAAFGLSLATAIINGLNFKFISMTLCIVCVLKLNQEIKSLKTTNLSKYAKASNDAFK